MDEVKSAILTLGGDNVKWQKSLGPKIRKELYLGTCPEYHTKAEIWAEYEGRLADKGDIALTYYLLSYRCNLVKPEKRCPHFEKCPFVKDICYF